MTVTAAVSLAVADLMLGDRRDVDVVAVFPRAAYLAAAGELLAVVTADGVALPNAAVLMAKATARPLAGLHRHAPGHVGDGVLEIGRLQVRVARWWDPRPRLRPTASGSLRAAAVDAEARMALRSGTAPDQLTAPLNVVHRALAAGDSGGAIGAASRLVGLGPGLTPAGDDVLCGLVAGVQLLAPVVAKDVAVAGELAAAARELGAAAAERAPDRTTAVSAAMLRHAARGEVAAPAATLLRAFTGHGDVITATDGLLAVGSTSGRDLLLGLLAAADLTATAARRTATANAPTGQLRPGRST